MKMKDKSRYQVSRHSSHVGECLGRPFVSFVIKEARHILRDRRTMLILFGMPVVMMLIFGFAITNEVKNVRTVVVTSHMNHQTQQVIERLAASEYFTITATVPTPQDAELMIRSQKADMSLTPSPSPKGQGGAYGNAGGIQWQIMVDGSDPNMAQQWTVYAQQIISNIQLSTLNSQLLYNPRMKSAYNFVPAIMGMLLLLICAMMTSVSIVREKERGTMEVLLVSPSASDDDYRSQGGALPGDGVARTRYHHSGIYHHPRRAVAGLAVVDSGCIAHLHTAGALIRPVHLEYRPDAVCSPARLGNGAAVAHRHALGHAVSGRVDAHSTAMAFGHRSATLLHRGHAQTDDYGCRHRRGVERCGSAYRHDCPAARSFT